MHHTNLIDRANVIRAHLIDKNQIGIMNQIGTLSDPFLQNGLYNTFIVDQSGNHNRVGTDGEGVHQNGQSASPTVFNQITITQTSDRNTVGEILQSALGAIPDGANRLEITQQSGEANTVNEVLQNQFDGMPGQSATLIQSGEGNVLARVEQQSLTPAKKNENLIHAEFYGIGNGAVGLSGFALEIGASSGELKQTIGSDGLGANGNDMSLSITGDYNRFGIFQGGRLNSVGVITIQGSQNQLGLRQDGLENDFTSSLIAGDGNIMGFSQWGTNTAYFDMVGQGDDNQVLVRQAGTNDLRLRVEGHRNTSISHQDFHEGLGGDNDAEIALSGSENFMNLSQNGSNIAVLSIEGEGNNTSGFSQAPLLEAGIDTGMITQSGSRNFIWAEVLGVGNNTAIAQEGTENTVTAFVRGNANQFVIVQAGLANTARSSQLGIQNSVFVSQ